jgi:hypothetical protein
MAELCILSSESRHQASQVGTIAEGLFAKTERQIVLLFVDDCETPFAIHEWVEDIPRFFQLTNSPSLDARL